MSTIAEEREYATVEVNGKAIDMWTEWSIDSDILIPADSFHMTLAVPMITGNRTELNTLKEIRDALVPGSTVKVYIGADAPKSRRSKTLQMSGVIDSREIGFDIKRGTLISIQGRDMAAHMVDSDVPLDILQKDDTFIDLIRRTVDPWGIEVITDGTAARDVLTGKTKTTPAARLNVGQAAAYGVPTEQFSRKLLKRAAASGVALDDFLGVAPSAASRRNTSNNMAPGDIERLSIKEAKPRVGESVWSFLYRHAQHLKLMMWMSPDGELIVSSPNYNQAPIHRIVRRYVSDPMDPNNVESGRESYSAHDSYSMVCVYGRCRGDDVSRAMHRGVAEDEDVAHHRLHLVYEPDITSSTEALQRANELLSRYNVDGQVLDYTMTGYGTKDKVFAVDTMCGVVDEPAGVDGKYYCIKRKFIYNDDGAKTRLRLVPPDTVIP